MGEYKEFKSQNFDNFGKLTKMVLANSHEMSIVKSVFD